MKYIKMYAMNFLLFIIVLNGGTIISLLKGEQVNQSTIVHQTPTITTKGI